MNTRIAVATALVISALAPAAADALTVKTHDSTQGGGRFTVRCGQTDTLSVRLPAGATNVQVTRPKVGDRVKDGFGDETLAHITAIDQRTEGGRPVVDVTATGSDYACEPINDEYEWDTNSVTITAEYDLVEDVKVFFSEEQAGMHPRQKPKSITATYDTGWKGLRWKSWGGRTAVAKGKFVGRKIVSHNGDAGYAPVTVPVEVKLSKVRICGSERWYYTKLHTEFLKSTPAEIQRQAKPLGTAGCLD